ncbi:MAG: hypothetical protein AAB583_02075 [Patescibacteria group bacterium]
MSLAERKIMPTYKERVTRLTIHLMAKDLPRFISSIPVEYPSGFQEEYLNAFRLGGKITPIIVASHTSHMDGAPLASITKTLTDLTNSLTGETDGFKGFVIPIASSMRSGHQGDMVKMGILEMEEITEEQFHLMTIDYTRKSDTQRYGLNSNLPTYINGLKQKVEEGYGIAVFPEGTMTAGRSERRSLIGKSQRFGMQKFKDMNTLIKLSEDMGNKILLIPVGIHGGYRLESPDNNRPTTRYLIETVLRHPTNLWHPTKTSLVRVKVGLPINYENVSVEDINTFLGETVAALLPPEARGVYA